jgi:hypothetical protein
MHLLASVLVAGILVVGCYLLSGLFGPRVQDSFPTDAPEPTEAEFNTQE